MKIAIYSRVYSEEYFSVYNKIFNELLQNNCEIAIHSDIWEAVKEKFVFNTPPTVFDSSERIDHIADFVFSIGGDGTLLNTITLVRNSGIPVLGFNTGRLGFLSAINREDIEQSIKHIKTGNFEVESRSMIQLQTKEGLFGEDNFALNEMCIHRKDGSSMIAVHAYVNNQFLNTYWADGLIVSTPTGSTAYSLSCGGPIITPDAENFIITPISTHNLTVRPIVIPDSGVIRLKAEGREGNFLVSLDSRSETIDSSIELLVRKQEYCFHLIKLPSANFFNTIREKLMWGHDKRN